MTHERMLEVGAARRSDEPRRHPRTPLRSWHDPSRLCGRQTGRVSAITCRIIRTVQISFGQSRTVGLDSLPNSSPPRTHAALANRRFARTHHHPLLSSVLCMRCTSVCRIPRVSTCLSARARVCPSARTRDWRHAPSARRASPLCETTSYSSINIV